MKYTQKKRNVLGQGKKLASPNAKDTNMLVFLALGNAKVLSFALGDAKVPNANDFAFCWNIGFTSLVLLTWFTCIGVGGSSLHKMCLSTHQLCSFSVRCEVKRLGGAYGCKISRNAMISAACALAAHNVKKWVTIEQFIGKLNMVTL